jgi:hypothetical protein
MKLTGGMMTNIPPEMMITHCEWDFYTAFMGFLPQLTLLATIYLLAHGLIRRRKTGVAKPFGEILWVATTTFLAIFLTLGLHRLWTSLCLGRPNFDNNLSEIFVAEFLSRCVWMIPPVALGFIGSFVLRMANQAENGSANKPSNSTR